MNTLTGRQDLKRIADELKRIAEATEQKKETHIVVVLDSSGSMGSIKTETINAFNDFVETVKKDAKKGGDTTVSLVVFGERGNAVKVKIDKQPVSAIDPLNDETYIPGAYTPMYDGIGTGINLVKSKDTGQGDIAFLVQIFTDGEENASREFTGPQIRDLVKSLEGKGNWTFTFAGANVDLNRVQQNIGLKLGNMVAFVANDAGMRGMSASNVSGTQSYLSTRGAGGQSMGNFYDAGQDVGSMFNQTGQTVGNQVNVNPLTTGDIKSVVRKLEAERQQKELLEGLDKQPKGNV